MFDIICNNNLKSQNLKQGSNFLSNQKKRIENLGSNLLLIDQTSSPKCFLL